MESSNVEEQLQALQRLIEDGEFAAAIENISKLTCQDQVNLLRSKEGAYLFGIALHRVDSPGELKRLIALPSVSSSGAGLKLACTVALMGRRDMSDSDVHLFMDLVQQSNGRILEDDLFLWATVNAGLILYIQPYFEAVPSMQLRKALVAIINKDDASLLESANELCMSGAPVAFLLLVASQLMDRERYEEALRLIDRALRDHPRHGDALAYKLFALWKLTREREFLNSPEVAQSQRLHHELATGVLRTPSKSQQIRKVNIDGVSAHP